jgi:thioredoxin-related protein
MKILSILAATMLFFAPNNNWGNDFEKAKTTAVQEKKVILLSFSGSDWCVPCIKMKKDIFESETFQKYADANLVLVRADFPRLKKNKLDAAQTKQNEKLAETYNPKGRFPYTVLIDGTGKVIKTWDGLPKLTPANFVKQVKEAK